MDAVYRLLGSQRSVLKIQSSKSVSISSPP